MKTTYGSMPTTMPAGFFKAVHFPVLCRLDSSTGEMIGRIIDSEGFSTRDLPLGIRAVFSSVGGHDNAVPTGTLFSVTKDPDTGVASGDGFLLDDDNGRRHARYAKLGAMPGNSVDLAQIKARIEEDLATGDFWIRFTESKLAATTGVSTPAFADARMDVVGEMSDEELVASLGDPMTPLEIVASSFEVNIVLDDVQAEPVEVLAAYASAKVPHELFHRPEPDRPQKIVVTEHGHVYGHLGMWDSCHDGIVGECVRIPRPTDGYASFNKPGVLTDRGIVGTGPIFAYGGHRRAKGRPDLEQAYGGIENAWADVRIVEGRFGPWISGIVRPGVEDTTVYAARASRISGHWVAGKLKAIVSVNAEGFDVPGDAFGAELAAGFAFHTDDHGVSELVASFPTCLESGASSAPEPAATVVVDDALLARVRELMIAELAAAGITVTPPAAADVVQPAVAPFDRLELLRKLLADD